MSTQCAVPSNGNNPNKLPKRLHKEAAMREMLFAHLDALDNRQFEELYEVLKDYMRLPRAVREELDRLDYDE